ncbi:hypothetical protein [Nocardioides sp. SYSU DS0651]|uniref:hypothetical protein n=1 Tax=Nocardioides sp. SYSU DS0651 TaxID=3415955 RepID=UPI003F4C4E43
MASSPDDHDRSPAEDLDVDWPPHVPHREIDALIDRLHAGATVDPAEAYRLLRLIAKEAQRLRAMSLRLTTGRLAEADREAQQIIAEALGHADSMRSIGLRVLNNRLDESERVLATLREAFRVELRAAEFAEVADERWRRPGRHPADQPADELAEDDER